MNKISHQLWNTYIVLYEYHNGGHIVCIYLAEGQIQLIFYIHGFHIHRFNWLKMETLIYIKLCPWSEHSEGWDRRTASSWLAWTTYQDPVSKQQWEQHYKKACCELHQNSIILQERLECLQILASLESLGAKSSWVPRNLTTVFWHFPHVVLFKCLPTIKLGKLLYTHLSITNFRY